MARCEDRMGSSPAGRDTAAAYQRGKRQLDRGAGKLDELLNTHDVHLVRASHIVILNLASPSYATDLEATFAMGPGPSIACWLGEGDPRLEEAGRAIRLESALDGELRLAPELLQRPMREHVL